MKCLPNNWLLEMNMLGKLVNRNGSGWLRPEDVFEELAYPPYSRIAV